MEQVVAKVSMHSVVWASLTCLELAAFAVVHPAKARPSGPVSAASAAPASLPPAQCLVVDSDGNLDDLRALALLATHRRVAAVVTTDGMVPADWGALIVQRFLMLATPGTYHQPTVIAGKARAAQDRPAPTYTFIEPARRDMRAVDQALRDLGATGALVQAPSTDEALGDAVAVATRDCDGVGLVVLGPWSSFSAYRDQLAPRLRFVVAQGRSPEDKDDERWDRINCWLDEVSCRAAVRQLGPDGIAWADMPGTGSSFPVDARMFTTLGATPAGKLLKELHQKAAPEEEHHQWDDMAALFTLRPDAFERVSQYHRPKLDCDRMRQLQIDLLNGRIDTQLVLPSGEPSKVCLRIS